MAGPLRTAQDREATSQQLAADHAAAAERVAALQAQVDQLLAEREALEQLKRATISDLRLQNNELRGSMRSLTASPSAALRSPGPAGSVMGEHSPGAPSTPGFMFAGGGAGATASGEAGSWQAEFESLVAQLRSDRAELREEVRGLGQAKASLEAQLADVTAQAAALQLEHDRLLAQPATVAAAAAAAGGAATGDDGRVQALEAELAQLKAQLAELHDVEAVIKEWSDYAAGLAAEKERLEKHAAGVAEELAAAQQGLAAAHATLQEQEQQIEQLASAEEVAEMQVGWGAALGLGVGLGCVWCVWAQHFRSVPWPLSPVLSPPSLSTCVGRAVTVCLPAWAARACAVCGPNHQLHGPNVRACCATPAGRRPRSSCSSLPSRPFGSSSWRLAAARRPPTATRPPAAHRTTRCSPRRQALAAARRCPARARPRCRARRGTSRWRGCRRPTRR